MRRTVRSESSIHALPMCLRREWCGMSSKSRRHFSMHIEHTKNVEKKRKCVMTYRLYIRVTDHLLLDAGTLEENRDQENRRVRMITPAPQTFYQQVIDYLTDATTQYMVRTQTAVDLQVVTYETEATY